MTINSNSGDRGSRAADSYPGNSGPKAPQPYAPQAQSQYAPPGSPPGYAPPPYAPEKPFSTKAIIAISCGAISVLFWPLSPITGVVGAITGWLGMKESKQPEGNYRGWGLALAGMLMSVAMFLLCIVMGLFMVWMFTFVADQQERMEQRQAERRAEHEYEEGAREDMILITDRLQIYFLEHGSLEPGGPMMREYPGGGLIPEDYEKVQEPLALEHLVKETELSHPLGDYKLRIYADKQGYNLRNTQSGLLLRIENARLAHTNFENGTTR